MANRILLSDAISLVVGARLSSWQSGGVEVSDELTPYAGIVYDLTSNIAFYASYTDIFNPQTYKNKNNQLLSPVLGTNTELGVKGQFLDDSLSVSAALFKTEQNNYPVRDLSEPENSLPDGSSAYISVDGTESEGIELSVSGHVGERWLVNAGYTYVDTNRHQNDRIWTNLPEHAVQLTAHYQFSGLLAKLVAGGGLNWQSATIGYGVRHPLEPDGVTFEQDPYSLVNLYATWQFNRAWSASLSATNAFHKKYWANIDYANYGEPRNISLSLRWLF